MHKLTMLDAPNKIRNIATLLAASLLMRDNIEEEQQTAIVLIDIALVRSRELAQDLKSGEARHA
ncbi:hypothetical protein [Hafnia psychrotolerans]|uniref:Uncharacterized protein n=1 Tax=Hafnia psychrotolerans TaxID=1477018 RepID=A0ABQ1H459_9GAMM|nr:hypothetical protein [Hafnia psychrotolerans]GGA58217.1 hypothetical protein GCM10011328_37130 [Hafnia psychrotolerans]